MSLFEHHHDTAEAVAVREEDAAARVKRLRQLMGELVVKIENEEGRSHHRQPVGRRSDRPRICPHRAESPL